MIKEPWSEAHFSDEDGIAGGQDMKQLWFWVYLHIILNKKDNIILLSMLQKFYQ